MSERESELRIDPSENLSEEEINELMTRVSEATKDLRAEEGTDRLTPTLIILKLEESDLGLTSEQKRYLQFMFDPRHLGDYLPQE